MFGNTNSRFVSNNIDYSGVEKLLIRDGQYTPAPAAEVRRFTQHQIAAFCHHHAIYQVVTTELIDWLKNEINGAPAIEIGAGVGWLGRTLNIPITDNCQQNFPDVNLYYKLMGQPTIKYPKDIIPYEELVAIDMFKPEVVVASWVTEIWDDAKGKGNYHGVDEKQFKGKMKKYILVGNEDTNGDKNILKLFPYKMYKFDWLVTRSFQTDKNMIYVFDCK